MLRFVILWIKISLPFFFYIIGNTVCTSKEKCLFCEEEAYYHYYYCYYYHYNYYFIFNVFFFSCIILLKKLTQFAIHLFFKVAITCRKRLFVWQDISFENFNLRIIFTQGRKKNPLIGTKNYLLFIVAPLLWCYFSLLSNKDDSFLFTLVTSECLMKKLSKLSNTSKLFFILKLMFYGATVVTSVARMTHAFHYCQLIFLQLSTICVFFLFIICFHSSKWLFFKMSSLLILTTHARKISLTKYCLYI